MSMTREAQREALAFLRTKVREAKEDFAQSHQRTQALVWEDHHDNLRHLRYAIGVIKENRTNADPA